ncbi:MAG: hypothetical protein D6718_05400 [Acidobacteria bacterium]|nr:MAG: hypothetical protein D6718_05400 [Acidobacteriota bacterium]
MRRAIAWALVGAGLAGAAACRGGEGGEEAVLDEVAREYVQLALELGEHDPDYVDAYYGPEEWREQARRNPSDPARIAERARELAATASGSAARSRGLLAARGRFLSKQLASLAARAEMLAGAELRFDEESQVLYDATAPHHRADFYQSLVARLDAELPGEGPVPERYAAYLRRFEIPKDRLRAVFDAAVRECRRRTLAHVTLPEGESFDVEYVQGQPWSAYNWYQGNFRSLIQVNTDLPVTIDRAVDLACHEGYPGHHVYNVLLEQRFVRQRGWVEFQIYPLFSPMSLVAEGSANYGIEVAFPGEERTEFERDVLFPLAGLDPAEAERFAAVRRLAEALSYAGNEAARDYLDGKIGREEAVDYLVRYALMPRERAEKRLDFIDKYRSYVINYNLGKDLVRGWVERRLRGGSDPGERWRAFVELLTSLRLGSDLAR